MGDLIDRSQAMMLLVGEAIAKYPRGFYYGLFAAANEIKELPAVDAVEVVRCKDCKHLRKDGAYIYCGRFHGMIVIRINDYCSYGERRTDG